MLVAVILFVNRPNLEIVYTFVPQAKEAALAKCVVPVKWVHNKVFNKHKGIS